MLIKFFGIYGGLVKPFTKYDTKNLVSFSVENLEESLLFEAGSNNVSSETLGKCKALLISHNHHDHVLHLKKLAEKVNKIYCPYKKKVKGLRVLPDIPQQIGSFEVSFLKNKHSRAGYCYKIRCEDKTISYTGDTKYFEELGDFCKNVDVLICEATLTNAYKQLARIRGHMIPETIIGLAKKAEPKLLVLTHFNKLNPLDYLKEVEKGFERVIASEEGLELMV